MLGKSVSIHMFMYLYLHTLYVVGKNYLFFSRCLFIFSTFALLALVNTLMHSLYMCELLLGLYSLNFTDLSEPELCNLLFSLLLLLWWHLWKQMLFLYVLCKKKLIFIECKDVVSPAICQSMLLWHDYSSFFVIILLHYMNIVRNCRYSICNF